jgi:CRP-like cAMP-binding protein
MQPGGEAHNHVLTVMSAADRAALAPHLQEVALSSGDVLVERGHRVTWVYFPLSAVVSVVTLMADGRAVESDTVGRESAVGLLCALGEPISVDRIFTQIAGRALRIPAARIRRQAEGSHTLHRLLIRHAQANLAQAHQSVACNALHDTGQRLARWLLMSQDRTGGDDIRLTHEFLATMLGVQRTTVTEALRALAARDLIRQERGVIHILDRAGLQAQVCECYEVLKGNLLQLIGADAVKQGLAASAS